MAKSVQVREVLMNEILLSSHSCAAALKVSSLVIECEGILCSVGIVFMSQWVKKHIPGRERQKKIF